MAISTSKESKETKNKTLGKSPFFQAKLMVNSPGDQYEKEADAVAEKIVSLAGNDSALHASGVGGLGVRPISPIDIQKKCAECEEEENIQMKGNYSGRAVDSELENGIHVAKTGGQPLPSDTQSSMESGFGTGFQDVKIHHDAKSNQLNRKLNARAFTTGKNIFFKSGEYNPQTREGKKLLAHELTHVVQQSSATGIKVQREDIEPSTDSADETEFEFDYNLLPPSLQFSLGQWMLEANTSGAALQFSHGLMKSRFGYNYGGNLTLGTQSPSSSVELGFNPHSPALSLNLTEDRFRFGANADLTTGGFGFNLGYGSKLLPMPFDLAGPVYGGWEGASGILGDIGNMQDPLSFYQSHGDNIDAVMGAVKALQPLANEGNQGFGAGLRFTYNPQTGVLIHAGVQWMF
jgi:hypothetical protein